MTSLLDVTVVAITDRDHGKTIEAIDKTLKLIKPAKTILFSDVLYMSDDWQCVVIDRLGSAEAYNHFVFKKLGEYVLNGIISTSHILIIQYDGYVIDDTAWTDEFLQYDYIGAPWTYTDGRNVGNGGFSLRSAKLHQVLMNDKFDLYSPEDEKICRYYRQTLEKHHGIKFAPDSLAHQFSFEMHKPKCKTFGFHNFFHAPYREPIVLKRTGAMGDVIMMEPVMEALHKKGYRVIIDTQEQYFPLFSRHHYQVELLKHVYLSGEDTSSFRVVNLDMAYETQPKMLVSLAYAKACGIDIEPRNPKLIWTRRAPIHDRYIVLHTDDTAMDHRNVHGVDWDVVVDKLNNFGYEVFRVGNGNGRGGIKLNTHTTDLLAWIIGGAHYFIGPDSGCAQIAVACDVPSFIFFGSVNPSYRYVLNDRIHPIQNACPVNKDGCYHDVISVRGQSCQADHVTPPCITHNTERIIESIIHQISIP